MKPFKLDPQSRSTRTALGFTREEIEEGNYILARTNEELKRAAEEKKAKEKAKTKPTV